MRQWFVIFQTGPGLVGPFENEGEAETWAKLYEEKYREMNGPHVLSWRVANSAPPAALEWW
ncbi:hypothetical protein [Longimicrobium sp.]|jgi:hypothetical protein|uniref:hypothetical protein n=1 Tax=Longimicrobium sp. TaxID=2029185 RepID=UPI002EDB03FF